ncbi:hypothetical protein Tsubulata_023200, partial [Turnera subulata]
VYLEANWIGRRSRRMPGEKTIESEKEQHLVSVATVKNEPPQLSRQQVVEADPADEAAGEASKIFAQQGFILELQNTPSFECLEESKIGITWNIGFWVVSVCVLAVWGAR